MRQEGIQVSKLRTQSIYNDDMKIEYQRIVELTTDKNTYIHTYIHTCYKFSASTILK